MLVSLRRCRRAPGICCFVRSRCRQAAHVSRHAIFKESVRYPVMRRPNVRVCQSQSHFVRQGPVAVDAQIISNALTAITRGAMQQPVIMPVPRQLMGHAVCLSLGNLLTHVRGIDRGVSRWAPAELGVRVQHAAAAELRVVQGQWAHAPCV
jgi:hypothetical protein